MTTNNPTPELVERLLAGISSYGDDGIVGTRAGLIREVAAIVTKQNDVIIDNISAIDEAKALISSQAASIAKLTAERDANWNEYLEERSARMASNNREFTNLQRAEAAEKRAKELEALIDGENCADPDKIDALFRRAETAEASNKLLSERVAVLETALEPFALACTITTRKDDEDIDDSIAATKITFGDLRRALAAREAK